MPKLNLRASIQLVVLTFLLSGTTSLWSAPEVTVGWQWRSPIVPAVHTQEFAKISLNDVVFDQSNPDLSDLRVIGAEDVRIPHYLPPVAHLSDTAAQWSTHLLMNRVFDPNLFQQVTIDFTSSQNKSKLKVALSDQNYYRRIQLEGSHDLAQWDLISNNLILADIQVDVNENVKGNVQPYIPNHNSYQHDIVHFAQNNFRYLRLTVFQMPDDIRPFEITRVSAPKSHQSKALPLLPVEITSQTVKQDDKNNTVIELDLAYKNLPIKLIQLDFGDARYYRGYKIEGKDSLIDLPPNSAGLTPTQSSAWLPMCRGILYQMKNSDGSESVNNQIELSGHPSYRHLKITLYNKDNPPLGLVSVRVNRVDRWVMFPTQSKAPQFLMYGNPKAHTPNYDLFEAYPNLESEPMATLTLGEPEQLFDPPNLLPWSERNRWLLGLILGLCVIVLGFGVFRQLKRPLAD